MARTQRLRNQVVKLLAEHGTLHTRAIYEHINSKSRWGTTMNQLGNILARDPRIEKQEPTARILHSVTPQRYNVCVWGLREGAQDDDNQV